MGWWPENFHRNSAIKQPFHLLAVILLSLWLPLAFLLVARLSYVNYVLNATVPDPSTPPPPSFLWSFYFSANPALIYLLVTSASVAALGHGLTGKLGFVTESTDTTHRRPRLCITWIILCIVQVSVGLGIEGSVAVGVDGAGFGVKRSFLSRMIFFLGMHEIMLVWYRTVVKPVADDSIFGVVTSERWFHRTAIATAAGAMWWWKLRNEVESLVAVAEAKKELAMDIEMADFLGWWLYYLTVTIGMVRVVKATFWLGFVLLCRRVRRDDIDETTSEEEEEDEEKV